MDTPLEHFHLFSELPSELRLKIYDHILAVPTTKQKSKDLPILDPQTGAPLPSPDNEHNRHILKISYTPSVQRYRSNTAPTILLSIWSESRIYAQDVYQYTPFYFGPQPDSIPIAYATTTLYISSLLPSLSCPPASSLLYTISTTPSRHKIESMALDLRVWNTLCEEGLLGVLGRMRGLREVWLVVEFGRREFKGSVGFLGVPGWRGDLKWIAERAREGITREKSKVRGFGRRILGREGEGGYDGEVKVGCVLLTRGGEQA